MSEIPTSRSEFERKLKALTQASSNRSENPGSYKSDRCERCYDCMFTTGSVQCYQCTYCADCQNCTNCTHCGEASARASTWSTKLQLDPPWRRWCTLICINMESSSSNARIKLETIVSPRWYTVVMTTAASRTRTAASSRAGGAKRNIDTYEDISGGLKRLRSQRFAICYWKLMLGTDALI